MFENHIVGFPNASLENFATILNSQGQEGWELTIIGKGLFGGPVFFLQRPAPWTGKKWRYTTFQFPGTWLREKLESEIGAIGLGGWQLATRDIEANPPVYFFKQEIIERELTTAEEVAAMPGPIACFKEIHKIPLQPPREEEQPNVPFNGPRIP